MLSILSTQRRTSCSADAAFFAAIFLKGEVTEFSFSDYPAQQNINLLEL